MKKFSDELETLQANETAVRIVRQAATVDGFNVSAASKVEQKTLKRLLVHGAVDVEFGMARATPRGLADFNVLSPGNWCSKCKLHINRCTCRGRVAGLRGVEPPSTGVVTVAAESAVPEGDDDTFVHHPEMEIARRHLAIAAIAAAEGVLREADRKSREEAWSALAYAAEGVRLHDEVCQKVEELRGRVAHLKDQSRARARRAAEGPR